MANIDKHAPGSFCWLELGTTDQAAAKNFYGSLFGWIADDSPMGPGEFYTIFKLQSRDAAAAYTLRADQQAQGVPPHWMLYIAVESADAATQRATELGGKVVAPAFDVMEHGRMAVLQDPTGAVFCVWQPMKNSGLGIDGIDGTLCWADLSTPDVARASEFYSALFGWKLATDEKHTGGEGYLHIVNGEAYIGGIPPASHRGQDTPPHWLPYIFVSDCAAVADKAQSLGANLFVKPMEMQGVGTISVVADPQGAVFSLFQPGRK